MAGSPSEDSTLFDPAESSSSANTQPAPLDWEVLSKSAMSSSTLGLPSQKPHESEDYKDQSFIEKALSDVSFSEPHQETHATESYGSQEDKEQEDTHPSVEPYHEVRVGAEGSTTQEDGSPAISSKKKKKKKIRVLWWKCEVFNCQAQSGKYNTALSIALVAAVVGIAVIGHRLHRERNLNHQLRLEVSSKEEKLNDMLYQVNRMKEAMTGRRRVGVTRNSFF